MNLITLSKKTKIWISVSLLLFTFIAYYLIVYKSFGYKSNNDVNGYLIILFSMIIFNMIWFNNENNWKFNIRIIITPIFSIVLMFWILSKKVDLLQGELNDYGTIILAKITELEIEHHFKGGQTDYATFKYQYQNKEFTQRIENYNNQFKLNQQLSLKISKRNPEMFIIINSAN